jgi:predicted nucleic acid-binding protein
VIAYVDTTALLRLILREPGAVPDIQDCKRLVSSELTAVEAMRTIERLRSEWTLSTDEAGVRRAAVRDWLDAMDLVLVREPILARAAEPMPVPLGATAAIHLATALLWREEMQQELVVATHDRVLAEAARAFGFEVIGA